MAHNHLMRLFQSGSTGFFIGAVSVYSLPFVTSGFVDNFLSDLISGLILLALGSFLVPKYLEHLKRKRTLDFYFAGSGYDTITAELVGENYVSKFRLLIRHKRGDSIFNGIAWHLYIPQNISFNIQPYNSQVEVTLPDIDKAFPSMNHYANFFVGKIFKDTTVQFNYDFTISVPTIQTEKNEIRFKYYFSTEFGKYPLGVTTTHDGKQILPESLGELIVRLPRKD